MAERDLIIRIKAEGAEAFISQIKKAGGEVEEVGDKAVKTGDRVTSSMKKVGAAVAAAFATAQVAQFIKQSVRLADIQLKAEAQLLKALKGREDVQQRLIKQAQQIQRTTIFGDEEIIRQQSFLAQLQFTEQQINDIINASVNLSAGLDISLDSAVRNVAKTFSGLSGELGELVPQLRGLTQEQLRSGEAVKLLTGLFEGQAETLRNTGVGSVTALQNAVGDLQEELGKAVLEGLTPFANQLQEISQNEDVITFFRALGQAIGGTLKFVAGAIEGYGILFNILKGNSAQEKAFQQQVQESSERALSFLQNRLELEREGILAQDRRDRADLAQLRILDEKIESVRQQRAELAAQRQAQSEVTEVVEKSTEAQEKANEVTQKSIVLLNQFFQEFTSGFISVAGTFNDVTLYTDILDQLGKTIEDLQSITSGGLIGDPEGDLQTFAASTGLALDGINAVKQGQIDAANEAEQLQNERLNKARERINSITQAERAALGVFKQVEAAKLQILQNRLDQGLISQKEYDEQRKELLVRQAKQQKAEAIFSTAINAAAGIVAQFKAGPAGIALATIVSALAAAQIAAIAATPIPQFATGTKGKKKAPKGFKWVGEEGPELLFDQGGYDIMTAKDSDQVARILNSYGIPTSFASDSTTAGKMDRPLKSLEKLTKDTPFEKMDWSPMLHATDKQRMSLGRKLDKIHVALLKNQAMGRPMTRA